MIILGNYLSHALSPLQLLESLRLFSHNKSLILLSAANSGSIIEIGKWATGDTGFHSTMSTGNKQHHMHTPASIVKLLLDAGWLPNMHEGRAINLESDARAQALAAAAEDFGISRKKMLANLSLIDTTFFAIEHEDSPAMVNQLNEGISVIVPVNKQWQYDANVAVSPGLQEINAEIIIVNGASSAAEAFEAGAAKAAHHWRLMIHQDVYIPKGSGFLILNELLRLKANNLHLHPIGFIGGEHDKLRGQFLRKGLVVDRVYPNSLLNHEPSASAVTLVHDGRKRG